MSVISPYETILPCLPQNKKLAPMNNDDIYHAYKLYQASAMDSRYDDFVARDCFVAGWLQGAAQKLEAVEKERLSLKLRFRAGHLSREEFVAQMIDTFPPTANKELPP